jgi:RHS repeat-associated protein
VAFTLVKPSSGTTWRIQQRYVNTGLDENVAARLWLNGTPTSLALVTDRQGGYIMGVKNNRTEETRTGFYLRNAFGKMESGSTAAQSLETHTGLGFAGAGTPTSAGGGYVYLRNRWYDPQTGRFLSQDPIGLAGGVNLYAYAGNNPVAYSDPFGLKADTIDTDPATRQKLDNECSASTTIYCTALHQLDAEPTHWKVRILTSNQPLPGNDLSGSTRTDWLSLDLAAVGGVGVLTVVTGGEIMIKPSDFHQNSIQEGGLPFTFGTVSIHEMGHALGNIEATRRQPLSFGTTHPACSEACTKQYVENPYRAQAHLGYRP